MTYTHFFNGLIGLIFIVSGGLAGCGKKADPRPTMVHRPPAIVDLGAVSGPAGAQLSWSVPGIIQNEWIFQVLRSESIDSEAFCPGCPQTYGPQTTLKLNDSRLKRIGERSFGYDDRDLREGRVYLYRVKVCMAGGSCGNESNSAGPVRGGQ